MAMCKVFEILSDVIGTVVMIAGFALMYLPFFNLAGIPIIVIGLAIALPGFRVGFRRRFSRGRAGR
jgi:uncharacterized membrane protein